MLNKILLTGRMTARPELKTTTNGTNVTQFSLAVQRNFKNGNGEYGTDFINCVAWRNQAEFLQRFVRKGNQLAVEGRIQTNSYTDANGNNRQAFDILVESVSNLEPVSKNDGYQPQPPFGNGFQPLGQTQSHQPEQVEFEVSEDDLPF